MENVPNLMRHRGGETLAAHQKINWKTRGTPCQRNYCLTPSAFRRFVSERSSWETSGLERLSMAGGKPSEACQSRRSWIHVRRRLGIWASPC